MNKIYILVLALLSVSFYVFPQRTAIDSITHEKYLRVFLDGAGDWENYIKVRLWYVDYVRDPYLADVQVIITNQVTAAGGSEYSIFLLGKRKYIAHNDTLHFTAPVEYTNRKTRDELTNVLTMGLMPYLLKSNQYKYMIFDYS
jgi:hypothetical protein